MADPYLFARRVGCWIIPTAWRHEPEHLARLQAIQSTAVIIGCNVIFDVDIIEFVGVSIHFDVVPRGMRAPHYEPQLARQTDGSYVLANWRRVVAKEIANHG